MSSTRTGDLSREPISRVSKTVIIWRYALGRQGRQTMGYSMVAPQTTSRDDFWERITATFARGLC